MRPTHRPPVGPGLARSGAIEARLKELRVPSAYIDVQVCRSPQDAWRFEGRSLDATVSLLSRAGLDATLVERARELTRCDRDGCAVFADAGLVWSLAPETRSTLYRELARYRANLMQRDPNLRSASLGPWSAMPGLTQRARDSIARLTWTTQGHFALSDIPSLCAALPSDAERAAALSTLRTREGLDVRVLAPISGELAPLVRYWSLGDDDHVASLFEEARRLREGVPLAELLPPVPRERLDTFPSASDQELDCFWTALNFFSSPDATVGCDGTPGFDRALRRRYTEVPLAEARFGDVVVFWSRDDVPVHAANLIADDVVFTKNGSDRSRPFTLMRLDEVRVLYPGTIVRAWRRRD